MTELIEKLSTAPTVFNIAKAHAFKLTPNNVLNAYMYSDASEILSTTLKESVKIY